jgi:hypothetical protein
MAFPFLLYRQDFAISKALDDQNHHLGHDIRLWAFHHHGSVLYAQLPCIGIARTGEETVLKGNMAKCL